MSHGDNRGLKLPPKVAPIQVEVIPIASHKEGVLEKAQELANELKGNFRVEIDDREQYTTGYKFNDCEMRGIPLRIEIGPKDIENNKCIFVRRDTQEKMEVNISEVSSKVEDTLEQIQENMYNECLKRLEEKTTIANNMEEFKNNLEKNQGFIKTMWCGSADCEEKIHEETGAKSRCLPFKQEKVGEKCVYCGKHADKMVIWGRQY